MEENRVELKKQPMSARGKIAMIIVVFIAVIYWGIAKIETYLVSIQER